MELFKFYSIIVILIITSNNFVKSIINTAKYYKYCKGLGNDLPFYPCHKWNKVDRKCTIEDKNGVLQNYTKFSDCLECIKRNETIPYPYEIPTCDTKCTTDLVWCELQQKCINKQENCKCKNNGTYCIHIGKDKEEHVNGKDILMRGTTKMYRCFSSEDLESRINKREYEICDDGSCQETYMNCTIKSTVTDATIHNEKSNDKDTNSTTHNNSNSSNLGVTLGLTLTFIILLSIGLVVAGVYFFYKRKKEETMWVDDNPDYGEVDDYDDATVVVDANEYYGKNDDDEEEETAIVDLNSDYGRLTVSVSTRGESSDKLGDIMEDSNGNNDDQIGDGRDSVDYDEMSTHSNDYDG